MEKLRNYLIVKAEYDRVTGFITVGSVAAFLRWLTENGVCVPYSSRLYRRMFQRDGYLIFYNGTSEKSFKLIKVDSVQIKR